MAEVKQEVIGSGDDAIYKTIKAMKRLAAADAFSKEIQAIADKASTKCKNNANCLALAAFNEVKKIITYKYDHINVTKYFKADDPSRIEFLTRPKYFAGGGIEYGDCDDMACLLASVCLNLGLRVNFVIIAHKGSSKEFSHVFNEILMKNKSGKAYWVPADLVKGDFGWAKMPVNRIEQFEVKL